jgi:hypothetical protein
MITAPGLLSFKRPQRETHACHHGPQMRGYHSRRRIVREMWPEKNFTHPAALRYLAGPPNEPPRVGYNVAPAIILCGSLGWRRSDAEARLHQAARQCLTGATHWENVAIKRAANDRPWNQPPGLTTFSQRLKCSMRAVRSYPFRKPAPQMLSDRSPTNAAVGAWYTPIPQSSEERY